MSAGLDNDAAHISVACARRLSHRCPAVHRLAVSIGEIPVHGGLAPIFAAELDVTGWHHTPAGWVCPAHTGTAPADPGGVLNELLGYRFDPTTGTDGPAAVA